MRIYRSTRNVLIKDSVWDSYLVMHERICSETTSKGVVGIGTVCECTYVAREHFLGGRYWFLNTISFECSSFLFYRTPISVCLRFERVYKQRPPGLTSRPWSWRGVPWPGEATRYLSPWKRANFVSRARTASVNWSRHNFCYIRTKSPTTEVAVILSRTVYYTCELVSQRLHRNMYYIVDTFSYSLLCLSWYSCLCYNSFVGN